MLSTAGVRMKAFRIDGSMSALSIWSSSLASTPGFRISFRGRSSRRKSVSTSSKMVSYVPGKRRMCLSHTAPSSNACGHHLLLSSARSAHPPPYVDERGKRAERAEEKVTRLGAYLVGAASRRRQTRRPSRAASAPAGPPCSQTSVSEPIHPHGRSPSRFGQSCEGRRGSKRAAGSNAAPRLSRDGRAADAGPRGRPRTTRPTHTRPAPTGPMALCET
jgi:hypothetical protein